MSTKPDIFQYENAADFLNAQLAAFQRKNPKFSARAWARKLKMPFPSNFSRILIGQRRLTTELARSVAANLGLDEKERAHLEVLSEIGRVKDPGLLSKLKEIRASHAPIPKTLSTELLEKFSKWHFSVIVEMLSLKHTETGFDWMRERLGNRIKRAEIKAVMDHLIEQGIAEQTATGHLRRKLSSALTNFTLIHESAVEAFLANQLDFSRRMVKKLPVGQRKLSSVTMALRHEDIDKAKKILDHASAELLKLSVHEDADQIYQFNAQLFAVTK